MPVGRRIILHVDMDAFYAEACRLLDRLDLDRPMRLVGLAAFDLRDRGPGGQGDLFAGAAGEARSERQSRVEHALDALRDRFGDVVSRAGRAPRKAGP